MLMKHPTSAAGVLEALTEGRASTLDHARQYSTSVGSAIPRYPAPHTHAPLPTPSSHAACTPYELCQPHLTRPYAVQQPCLTVSSGFPHAAIKVYASGLRKLSVWDTPDAVALIP
jgi:hypothetical protein